MAKLSSTRRGTDPASPHPPLPWVVVGRTVLPIAVCLLGCVLAVSCSLVEGLLSARSAEGVPVARRTSFHGWRQCWRLTNGLVRVTAVPQIGGRPLEYALGECNFLFIGKPDLGATVDAQRGPGYRYFGGSFTQLHPEDRWVRLQSSYPPDLFMGRYEAEAAQGEGGAAAVDLTSPPDLASGTRLVRRLELFPGCTRLRITDTLTNLRPVSQEWGIHSVLQIKGVAVPDGILRGNERPSGDLTLYVPLSAKSAHKGGVTYVTGGEGTRRGSDQWNTRELPGILTLRYAREFGKALVDPELPWVALADRRSGYVFVQKCRVPEKAILSAGAALTPYPFIEVQCFGTPTRLGPGETSMLVQDWWAACCRGPVVDVTQAGVVSSPLKLLQGGGRTWLAGAFGVFYVGRADLVFQAADGAELARLGCGFVTPLRPFTLNRAADVPPRTARVILEVRDAAGQPVGDLGRLVLGAP